MRTWLVGILILVSVCVWPAAGVRAQEMVTPEGLEAALWESGFPVEGITIYDAATDPNRLLGRPGQYIGKVNWIDQRAPDGTATVEVFPTLTSLENRQRYVEAISATGGPFTMYVYAHPDRLLLLRLPFQLLPEDAAAYELWLLSR